MFDRDAAKMHEFVVQESTVYDAHDDAGRMEVVYIEVNFSVGKARNQGEKSASRTML